MKKQTVETQATSASITIPALELGSFTLTLVGDSSLISHRWSEKAKKEMLDKQMKKATKGREAKDPEKEYLASLYTYPGGGYGFPSTAFKNAAVDACTSITEIAKTEARAAFHVNPGEELVKIEGAPSMREDMVKISMGTADIRYRGEFKEWKVKLTIRYNKRVLSIEQIVNLFNVAGFGVGVGEWRPQKDGNHGMFHVQAG